MLQQTQVLRVVEKFTAFVEVFPTTRALADAPEDRVLAMWSGLGYYRRARNLHAAAKQIIEDHNGSVPRDAESLKSLRGVGRYTAGAIASIAYDDAEPIVDGNVTRVVLRLEGEPLASDDPGAIKLSWSRAKDLVVASERSRAKNASPGTLNEALMELGATVCTPANPQCLLCPIQSACKSYEHGTTDQIPLPKQRAKRKPLYVACVVCERDGRVLVRKRPDTGLWAGLYESPTLERNDRPSKVIEIEQALDVTGLRPRETFSFATTHRNVVFEVFTPDRCDATGEWLTRDEIASLGLSNPQRRILLDHRDDATKH